MLFLSMLTLSLNDPFSLDSIANNIASATFEVLNGGKVRTADMAGGSATTSDFTAAIIKALQ